MLLRHSPTAAAVAEFPYTLLALGAPLVGLTALFSGKASAQDPDPTTRTMHPVVPASVPQPDPSKPFDLFTPHLAPITLRESTVESLFEPTTANSAVGTPSVARFPSMPLFHEKGAPFSGAIIDPLEVHHAHIENEQRINFGFVRGFRNADGTKRGAFDGSLEMAYAYGDSFAVGTEAKIPFATTGDNNELEIGDTEFWPVKYSFVHKPDEVASVYVNSLLPTGSQSRGTGGGALGLGAILLYDRAWGNVYWGTNVEYLGNVTGPTGSDLEGATALAYSFINDTPGGGMAPPLPKQKWVPSVSLEFVYSQTLSGDESGADSITTTPGFTLWNTNSGWQVHLGYRIPTGGDRRDDGAVLLQVGNHFNWGRMFGASNK